MVLLCFTIGLEKKFPGTSCYEDITYEFNKNKIFYSAYDTKNKIILKTFIDKEEIKKTVSNILCEYVFSKYIKERIYKYLKCYYSYFSDDEKKEIYESLFDERERKYLSKKIYEFLCESDSLIIEGFVNFRLKDYLLRCEDRVEIIVEDMLIRKEYYEFIGYLKYFINVQNHKCEVVSIVKEKTGLYTLYDENNEIINNDVKKEFMFEFADEEFCVNDVLINDLISISPKRVVVHNKENFENAQILKTIESIFENKFSYCDGCALCREENK